MMGLHHKSMHASRQNSDICLVVVYVRTLQQTRCNVIEPTLINCYEAAQWAATSIQSTEALGLLTHL